MNKYSILWFVLFLNLASVGAGLGYVAYRPAIVRDVFSGGRFSRQLEASIESAQKQALPLDDKPATGTPTPKGPTPRATPPPKGTGTRAAGAGAAGTTSAAKTPPPKDRRPPKKAPAASKEPTEESIRKIEPSVTAKYVGTASDVVATDAPIPELYPFAVRRRTFPNADEMEVEILIQNLSGYFWSKAFVVLKSPDFPKAEVFEIADWGIDQVALVPYRFPKDETQARLRLLRIARVSGEKKESALAGMVGEKRGSVAGEFGTKETTLQPRRAPLEQPGLLGLWARASTAVQTSEQPAVTAEAAAKPKPAMSSFAIALPEASLIPEELPVVLPALTAERRTARDLLDSSHASARAAQKEIGDFVKLVNEQGFKKAMEGDGPARIEALRAHLRQFEDQGLKLAALMAKTQDEQISNLEWHVNKMADSLILQIDTVNGEVRKIEPTFSLDVE
ncbi:hypothetical protein HZA57_02385 [Candidatus Poribacteria bacterium]|nr:hypothetical protein [Candidatus Poribacteria bacterium]